MEYTFFVVFNSFFIGATGAGWEKLFTFLVLFTVASFTLYKEVYQSYLTPNVFCPLIWKFRPLHFCDNFIFFFLVFILFTIRVLIEFRKQEWKTWKKRRAKVIHLSYSVSSLQWVATFPLMGCNLSLVSLDIHPHHT